jgi:putative transposase
MSRPDLLAMVVRGHAAVSVRRQCALLGVARAGVYRPTRAPGPEDLALMRRLDALYLEAPFFGSRRMVEALRRDGVRVGRHRVRRLMRRMGLEALAPKPGTSRPAPGHRIYPYRLRGLTIERPNQVSYIPMARGFLYLVAIIDWFSRAVLAWRLSNTMDAMFCVEVLEMALARFGEPEIFNTDQGAQFTSAFFTGRLEAAGIAISMDGRGRWLDNVFIERLWRSLKYEEGLLRTVGLVETYVFRHAICGIPTKSLNKDLCDLRSRAEEGSLWKASRHTS